MKFLNYFSLFIFLCCYSNLSAQDGYSRSKNVGYYEASISSVKKDGYFDKYFRMYDGSVWRSSYPYDFHTGEFYIIFESEGNYGTGYTNSGTYTFSLYSGKPSVYEGKMLYVEKEYGDGSVLKLSDGCVYEVDSYDTYNTRYWYPPYKVLMITDRKLIYLEKQKKIGITLIK
jgi:hypothetical protein